MKGLILGISGMAGHTIARYFIEQKVEIEGFSKESVNFCKTYIGDALEFEKMKELVLGGGYDFVINAIGILNESAENNKSAAVLLNSYLPHFLVEVTKNTKIKIVHMSTDCVFSGKKGSYLEHSLRDGETFYDRTKALGEIDNKKDLTFRNSIIGPDINQDGIGLFNWFMKQSGTINGYNRAIWTGVTTLTLAKAMYVAINENLTGIYNLVNNQEITKYEILRLFNKYFKANSIIVVPYENELLNKSLVNSRKDFTFIVPSYENMILEMYEWTNKYHYIYPHYELITED